MKVPGGGGEEEEKGKQKYDRKAVPAQMKIGIFHSSKPYVIPLFAFCTLKIFSLVFFFCLN